MQYSEGISELEHTQENMLCSHIELSDEQSGFEGQRWKAVCKISGKEVEIDSCQEFDGCVTLEQIEEE